MTSDTKSIASKKWHSGIDAKGLSRLSEISTTIEDVVRETVTTVARARLRIGSLLIDARAHFRGDKEFGQWRAEVVPDLAPRTANTYMNMSRQFKSAPELLEAVGWTNAREFMSIQSDLKEEVQRRLEKGEEVVPEDIKQVVKEGKPSEPTGGPGEASGPESAQMPGPEVSVATDTSRSSPVASLDIRIARILESHTIDRIAAVMDGEFKEIDPWSQACLVFGFGPELLGRKISEDVWAAISDYIANDVMADITYFDFVMASVKKIEDFWANDSGDF